MKKIFSVRKSILSVFLFCLIPIVIWSGSPITHTPFYTAYLDFKMVEKAELKGFLDNEVADYLLSPKLSLDLKAAIINALSFEILGKDNSNRFISFLNKKYHSDDFVQYQDKLTADELFCLGYLLVMDDYFSPKIAIPYLKKAKEMEPNDYTINMILAITSAQSIFNVNKCKACKMIDDVIKNKKLTDRMLPEAEETILIYFNRIGYECH
ncbi:MAG: hypothetical protein ISR55_07585 [Bacteroidetes bacterium]|nr:hypothetical protein [Bacteroidota bacterium]